MPLQQRPSVGRPLLPLGFQPDSVEVEDLIGRAEAHPLGTEFLREGSLDAVAATFRVHAFTVLSARERLGPRLPRRGNA
jgi:hypothetical protein